MEQNENLGPLFEYHSDSRQESSAGVLDTSEEEHDERDTCPTCHNGGFCSKHDRRDGIIPSKLYVSDVKSSTADDPVTDEERVAFFEQWKKGLGEK